MPDRTRTLTANERLTIALVAEGLENERYRRTNWTFDAPYEAYASGYFRHGRVLHPIRARTVDSPPRSPIAV